MSWVDNPWLQWFFGLAVVLMMLAMPVFAGHGGGPFGFVMVFGIPAWWPVVTPAWLGTVALLLVTPLCSAPMRNWVALVGLFLVAAALGFTQGFAGDAVLIPALLYAFLGAVVLVSVLNTVAIMRVRSVA